MWHYVLFAALFIGSVGYAAVMGGAPERITALVFTLGLIASLLVVPPANVRGVHVQWATFAIDLAMAAALVATAMRSTRWWPLLMTVFQAFQVGSHFARLLPNAIAQIYSFMISFWAFPMLLMLAIATLRHRERMKRDGTDPAWMAA